MILKIGVMIILFEIITSAVGDKAGRGDDVEFTHAPSVEARLGEKGLKDAIASHLHIADPETKALYIQAIWKGSSITMMKNPANSIHSF
jgi:hypothetical protein